MKVTYSEEKQIFDTPMGVGLGNFDGLHIGHMALVNTLINECRISGFGSLVYTFMKHPENILRKKLFTPLLTTTGKKTQLLAETPLDYLYFEYFDECFSRMKPEAFVKDILIDRLKIKLAVTGFNYRYGYKGQGDANLMKEMGKLYNFKVIVIPPVKVENEVVSSTLIRNYVAKGDMDKVFKLLGRHYSITGKVSTGKRIGSKLGFPTANIYPEDYLILPSDGVYATRTSLGGRLYCSITNIGRNPTIEDNGRTTVETHILDFDDNIYDKDIEVFFISKIRGEKKFKSKDELADQINKDVCVARNVLL
jgi:riboflavin kinase/FMN adenylyltransferase